MDAAQLCVRVSGLLSGIGSRHSKLFFLSQVGSMGIANMLSCACLCSPWPRTHSAAYHTRARVWGATLTPSRALCVQ